MAKPTSPAATWNRHGIGVECWIALRRIPCSRPVVKLIQVLPAERRFVMSEGDPHRRGQRQEPQARPGRVDIQGLGPRVRHPFGGCKGPANYQYRTARARGGPGLRVRFPKPLPSSPAFSPGVIHHAPSALTVWLWPCCASSHARGTTARCPTEGCRARRGRAWRAGPSLDRGPRRGTPRPRTLLPSLPFEQDGRV